MSKKQVTKFKTAFERYGYTIPDDGIQETKLGRQRIVKIVAPDGSIIANPADLIQARKTSPEVRGAMKRVFNPVYYGLSDKVANTFLETNRTNKQKKITGTNEEEMKKQMAEATSGERAGGARGVVLTDAEGEYVVDPDNVDEDGKPIKVRSGDDNYESVKAAAEQKITDLEGKSTPGLKATGGLFRAAAGGVSALGVADSACTVYNLARAVGATAKAARSMQLVQYAMVVNSAADSIKAGDATQEEVEFVGNMLTTTDTRETVLSESTQQQEANPFYGKAAFDSPGYKTAAYNEAPTLTAQSQQYMVGGGLSGSLSNVMSDIEGVLTADNPQALRDTCGVIQSPWVRGAGLVAGVFLAIGSFGVGTAVSIAASAAVGFAVPFLEAALSDIVAGNVIGENISGVDAGDAFFAGTSALLGGIAMKRGMAPLGKSGIQSYLAATEDTRNELIADAKNEASQNQFDVYNQYSFLGSLTRTLFPVVSQAKSSASGALMSVGSLFNTGIASLTQDASAAQTYNEARFSKCNDPGYEELGIDADIFCNVRYGLTDAELAMDSEAVVDFMIANDYISSTGNPQGDYDKFMENCVNREDGWGESSAEEQSGEKLGKKCIDGSGETYANISYFRVYTMDYSISEAMDDEQDASSQVTGDGSFVLPTDPGYGISSTWGPRSCSGCSTYHKAIDISNFPGGTAGKNVYAIGDGEVIKADMGNPSCQGGMGNAPYSKNNPVQIRHDNGVISVYLHMPVSSITVKEGDRVTAGQQIGKIGNCGQSFGDHLHFETMVGDDTDAQIKDIGGGDAYGQWRNPLIVMPLLGVDIQNGTYTDGR